MDRAAVDLSTTDFYRLTDEQRSEWEQFMRLHGVDPYDTFRVVVDGDCVTFHRHARNENGNFFVGPDGEPATREPLTVPRRTEVPA